MKLRCDTATGSVCDLVPDGLTVVDAGKVIVDAPAGFTPGEIELWRYDAGSSAVVKRTGQDLVDATAKRKATLRSRLKDTYLPQVVVTTDYAQRAELVLDALVQIVDKLVDGQTPTSQEKAGWKKLLDGLKNDYKKAVKDIDDTDKDDLKDGKKAVRKAETDMTHDPEWPA